MKTSDFRGGHRSKYVLQQVICEKTVVDSILDGKRKKLFLEKANLPKTILEAAVFYVMLSTTASYELTEASELPEPTGHVARRCPSTSCPAQKQTMSLPPGYISRVQGVQGLGCRVGMIW